MDHGLHILQIRILFWVKMPSTSLPVAVTGGCAVFTALWHWTREVRLDQRIVAAGFRYLHYSLHGAEQEQLFAWEWRRALLAFATWVGSRLLGDGARLGQSARRRARQVKKAMLRRPAAAARAAAADAAAEAEEEAGQGPEYLGGVPVPVGCLMVAHPQDAGRYPELVPSVEMDAHRNE